jgi:hypothetical protein
MSFFSTFFSYGILFCDIATLLVIVQLDPHLLSSFADEIAYAFMRKTYELSASCDVIGLEVSFNRHSVVRFASSDGSSVLELSRDDFNQACLTLGYEDAMLSFLEQAMTFVLHYVIGKKDRSLVPTISFPINFIHDTIIEAEYSVLKAMIEFAHHVDIRRGIVEFCKMSYDFHIDTTDHTHPFYKDMLHWYKFARLHGKTMRDLVDLAKKHFEVAIGTIHGGDTVDIEALNGHLLEVELIVDDQLVVASGEVAVGEWDDWAEYITDDGSEDGIVDMEIEDYYLRHI